MEEDFPISLANWNIDQLSYVYKDVEKHARIMEDIYNTPKFSFIDSIDGNIVYRGKNTKVSMRWGAVNFFNIQIEFIQLLEGECIYKEFLDQGREGFHHVGIKVKDIQAYIDLFKRKGIEVLQSERIVNLEFVYLDTEKTFGIMIRLFELGKGRRRK